MILLAFEVPRVQPRPKGSLAGRCLKDRKHTVVYREQVAESKKYRTSVKHACVLAMNEIGVEWLSTVRPWTEAVEVRAKFYLARNHVIKDGKRAGAFWPSHDTALPTAHDIGDLDKMCRNVGDALTDSGLIADDSLITKWLDPEKLWAPDNVPVTFIEVWTSNGLVR